jgi:hypothetical protein
MPRPWIIFTLALGLFAFYARERIKILSSGEAAVAIILIATMTTAMVEILIWLGHKIRTHLNFNASASFDK